MKKFITTAEMRDLEKQVSLGEVSYSRMIELLNEKADKYHESKVNELTKSDVIGSVCRCKKCNCEIKIDVGVDYCECTQPTLGKSVSRCGTCDKWFKAV